MTIEVWDISIITNSSTTASPTSSENTTLYFLLILILVIPLSYFLIPVATNYYLNYTNILKQNETTCELEIELSEHENEDDVLPHEVSIFTS